MIEVNILAFLYAIGIMVSLYGLYFGGLAVFNLNLVPGLEHTMKLTNK